MRLPLRPARVVRGTIAALLLLAIGACQEIRLVTPYDEQLDTGLTEYSEKLNGFLALMPSKFGTPAGVVSANEEFYAERTGQITALLTRAEARDIGKGCLLSNEIRTILRGRVPAEIAPAAQNEEGTSEGCTVILLQNIKSQLPDMKEVHEVSGGINTDLAKSLGDIMNQAIRAAQALEQIKRTGE